MFSKTDKKELTFHIEGTPSDGGDVRLGVFASKLDDFRLLFDEAQAAIDRYSKDDLLVTNLSHNSPSATTMQPTGNIGAQALVLIVESIGSVNKGLNAVANDHYEFYEKLRSFCKTNFNKIGGMWFSSEGEVLTSVSKETIDALDTLLMPGFSSIGSVKGVVEGYNSHPEEKYFYLYPLIGGRVKCLFDEERRQSAAQAVDKNVLVHGKLKYRGGQFFPYEVEVSSIEILSPDNDLPHLKDVVLDRSQIDSDSTQKIKRLRDEW